MSRANQGFTLVELIVTIIILGILATVAGPKFFGKKSYNSLGFSQMLVTSVHYAQKRAMSSGCNIRLQLTIDHLKLFRGVSSCKDTVMSALISKVTGEDFIEDVPAGLSVETMDIFFDSRGRPNEYASASLISAAKIINIDSGKRQLTIEAETGFAYVINN